MRHLLRILTVVGLILTFSLGSVAAPKRLSTKEREKITKEKTKEAKKLAKEYKKQGWIIEQTGSPENVIANFLISQEIDGLESTIGTAEGSASRSKARSYIKLKVANEYAQEQSGIFKGIATGMDSGDELDSEEKFVKQWESRYAMEIAGILKVGYSKYKKNDDGTIDMEIHYLIDPENAHAAKLSAARHAIEIQKLNQEWADNISKRLNDINPE